MRPTTVLSLLPALILSLSAGSRSAWEPAVTVPAPRMHAVKIKVGDMARAVEFYSGVLGYPVDSMRDYPDWVSLRDETVALWLERTSSSIPADTARAARTGAGFQALDLASTMKRLESREVHFLNAVPERVGVGISSYFRDPFGNGLYYLEQQVGDKETFREPRIYNAGFTVPDMQAAREFYSGLLGFVVRSEKYLPPALPLGHPDGTFAFMLHYSEGLSLAKIDYPSEPQIVIVLSTPDLRAFAAVLEGSRAQLISEEPRPTPLGPTLAVRDPFGNVFEVVEPPGGNPLRDDP